MSSPWSEVRPDSPPENRPENRPDSGVGPADPEGIRIRALDPATLPACLPALSELLAASVADGAAIGFLQPLDTAAARAFWEGPVAGGLGRGDRVLLVAAPADAPEAVLGTVQLVTGLPANQAHRADIAKMIVAPGARRRGLGAALMRRAIAEAERLGRGLLVLDTRRGDAAEGLYARLGFRRAGVIPDYARDPDGRALHDTVVMYRRGGGQGDAGPDRIGGEQVVGERGVGGGPEQAGPGRIPGQAPGRGS